MGRKKTEEVLLQLPVVYGGLSIGDEVCSLGLVVERKALPLGRADQNLVNKRLTCRITAVPGNDNPDQGQLPGAEDEQVVTGMFDCKGFSVGRKFIRFHLAAKKTDVDLTALGDFPKRAGQFYILAMEGIPEPARRPAAVASDNGEEAE